MAEVPKFDGSMEQLIARSIPEDPILQSQLNEEYTVYSEKERDLKSKALIACLVSIGIPIGTMLAIAELYISQHDIATGVVAIVGGPITWFAINYTRNLLARVSEARNGITAMQIALYNHRLNNPNVEVIFEDGDSNIHPIV